MYSNNVDKMLSGLINSLKDDKNTLHFTPYVYEPNRPNQPDRPDRRDMSNVETRPHYFFWRPLFQIKQIDPII